MATKLSEAQDNLLTKIALLTHDERVALEVLFDKFGPGSFDALQEYFEAVDEERDWHADEEAVHRLNRLHYRMDGERE